MPPGSGASVLLPATNSLPSAHNLALSNDRILAFPPVRIYLSCVLLGTPSFLQYVLHIHTFCPPSIYLFFGEYCMPLPSSEQFPLVFSFLNLLVLVGHYLSRMSIP